MGNSKVIIGIAVVIAIAIGIFAMNYTLSDNNINETSQPSDQITIEDSITPTENLSPNLGDNSTDETPKKHVIIIGDTPKIKE